MAASSVRAFGLLGCLLTFFAMAPARAEPFFVRVYGKTYKIDPRYPPDEPKGPKPQEAMKALPSDIGKGSGFKPSHEQVLAEVEERLWIARNQLEDELDDAVGSQERNSGADPKTIKEEIAGSLAGGTAQARSPELQKLYDYHRALNLLVRELRRSLDLPLRTPGAGFSRPKLSPEIEASYRDMNFDPLEAYYSFRRVKAAFRSGDAKLLSHVTHFPLAVTGWVRRTIRNRDQLIASKNTVLDPGVREAVAKSAFETAFVRDKGMMLGEGRVWITHDKTGFALGAINLE